MKKYRMPLLLGALYLMLVLVILISDIQLQFHGVFLFLLATAIIVLAILQWVKEEDIADQQYVESVMRSDKDCLVCSGRARVSDLDRFSVLGLCRPHLKEWAQEHGVWRENTQLSVSQQADYIDLGHPQVDIHASTPDLSRTSGSYGDGQHI